jgi:MFS family permease
VEQRNAGLNGAGTRNPARLRAFLLLCAMGLLGRLSYEMLRTPVTALYARHLGAPDALVGLLVSAVTITGIFVKLPAGIFADRLGASRLLGAGLLVKATAPFLYPLAATPVALLFVRLYHGLSTALYAPAASAEAARSVPAQRGRRLGFYGAAENAGVVLGPVLGAALLAQSGFALAFAASGVIGILAFLPVLAYHPAGPAPTAKTPRDGALAAVRQVVAQVAHDPQIRVAGLVEATLYAAIGTVQAFFPLYAAGAGLSVWETGLALGGQGVASILLRPWMGALGDRRGRTGPIASGLVACAASLAALPHASHLATLLPLLVCFGAGTAAVTPSTTALIGERARQGALGSAMGVFGSLWDVGHAGGPLIAGLLVAALGYAWTFGIVAGTLLMALAAFARSAGTGRRSRA